MAALPHQEQSAALDALMGKIDNLAVLPHVVFKVLEVTGDSDSPAIEMEKAITIDPGFSSKVLTLANSAYFGLPKRVTSIKESLMFLGFKSVRNLAMTVGAFDMFVGKNDEESLRRRTWWRHSVDSAVCAKWLAKSTGKMSCDEAYTCGLLHYLGKTLLDRFGEGNYTDASHLIEAGMLPVEAERQIFGCDHVEVAVGAAKKWAFPEGLTEGLRYVEEPKEGEPAREERACTALASAIARIAKQGRHNDELDVPHWAFRILGLQVDQAEAIVDDGIGEISSAQLSF
ncbi:MAG: HDOD domain-containing protein [Armatimonadetes bacterium]|nr:HDOD domain-containing protein [Armatimonadota bacterium]